MKAAHITSIAIIIASLIIGIYFYPQLPDQVASHWNTKGEVNGYIPKFWGAFLMPIITIGLFLLFLWLPKADPYKKNVEKFRGHYDWLIVVIILFLFYIHIITTLWNTGYQINMSITIMIALAGLFYYIGVMLPKSKRNWFMGIRTPWTLSSDKVWQKTHKLGGVLFRISALIILIGTFFSEYLLWFVLVPVLATVIWTFIYSYVEYKKVKR